MRRAVIAGNWKMFKTRGEAHSTVRELAALLGPLDECEVVVCPPFTALDAVRNAIQETASKIQCGAQNVHWEAQGAFTGEVSVSMLLDCGCRYVILGHSERREYFSETDVMINKKLRQVLSSPLTPILCIGETLRQREQGLVLQVVASQLEGGLAGLTPSEVSRIILAYEPVWAIGTGRTATPEIAEEVHQLIRNWLKEKISSQVASAARILYGGSVKPENIDDLMAQPDIDGALVGGASLDPKAFARIVNFRKA
ncbi:MAG: triose-phosphate isomerase [Acidobacteria bacterium]|nr:triose-phosphate isomerase [Acidobacteriota bacterium]